MKALGMRIPKISTESEWPVRFVYWTTTACGFNLGNGGTWRFRKLGGWVSAEPKAAGAACFDRESPKVDERWRVVERERKKEERKKNKKQVAMVVVVVVPGEAPRGGYWRSLEKERERERKLNVWILRPLIGQFKISSSKFWVQVLIQSTSK